MPRKLFSLISDTASRTNPRFRIISAANGIRPILAITFLVTGVLVGTEYLGGFQPLELAAYDRMVRWRQDTSRDPRILTVGITEDDLQAHGPWPLSDRVLAQTLETLQQHRPRAIGIDLHREMSQPPGRDRLIEQLQAPNTIVITHMGNTQTARVPPPDTVPESRVGFNDLPLDPDGVVRRNLVFASTEEQTWYSFSLRLALQYLESKGIELQNSDRHPEGIRLGQGTLIPLETNAGGYQTIDAHGYQILLNYRRSGHVGEQVTLSQVLSGQLRPEQVEGKIVTIGTVAPSLKDLFFTPYSAIARTDLNYPGVEIHAHMVSQLLGIALGEREVFWFWSEGNETLWTLVWVLAGVLMAWLTQRPTKLVLFAIVGLGSLFGIGFAAFVHAGWIPVALPAVGFIFGGGSVVVYKSLHNAFHDTLTGLPNRASFANRLGRLVKQTQLGRDERFGVLFLDLDRFKAINDSLGHGVGDCLLVAIAGRLKKCLRPTDLVARVGGDEFAILVKTLQRTEDATKVAHRLAQQLALPFNLNGHEIFATASIGIALGRGSDGRDLLRDAHTAMYRAKASGKGYPEVFEATMQTEAVARFQLETDLRRAVVELESLRAQFPQQLVQSQFAVYYQPLVDLATGRIIGFEALVRWNHPQRGFVSPGQFIPIAEEIGAIVPLGDWILEQACRQVRRWQDKFNFDPPLTIGVNLSGKQFSQPDLPDRVAQVLQQTGLSARCLKLEITESIVMEDAEATIDILLQMKALQVQLAIDDFGTGYSSLSYLHRFPNDTLKVDKSFVTRMQESDDNAAIVRTIVSLAHILNMDTIAEGIETHAQLEKLRSLGCEYGQGYLFAKPLPSEEAEALLASNPKW